MVLDQCLTQHPSYLFYFDSLNDITTPPVSFVHKQTNHVVTDCFQEILLGFP